MTPIQDTSESSIVDLSEADRKFSGIVGIQAANQGVSIPKW